MLEESLQARIGDILTATREALGVARARCYAMDPTGDYRLAARFGFPPRFAPEGLLTATDPLIDWIQRHRKPIYANSPAEAGPLGRSMDRDQYARTLAAPIYDGSRLAGVLELQEKLGGAFFNREDLHRIEPLLDQIAAVLREYGTGVAAPEDLAPEDAEALFFAPAPTVFDELPAPPPLFETAPEEPPPAVREPTTSYEATQSLASPPAVARAPALSRREVLLLKGFVSTLLLESDVAAAVFSYWTDAAGEISISARQPLSSAARDELLGSLDAAFASARPGVSPPLDRKVEQEFPLGKRPGELAAFAGAQSSVVFSGAGTLLLTVVFARPPDPANQPALAQVHRLVQSVIRGTRDVEAYRVSYRSLVNFLLEPGRRPYPQLKAHSLSVAALCRKFAASLGLGAEIVEQLTVAGLLHDIGLKELRLPYERISGRRPLDLEELGIVRQHPVLGASLLERIEFPYPIVPLVRHHHERFDGSGYPDRVAGEKIPLGSRILALAESYDAMTAPHSYRSPVTQEAALEIISLKAGTQFDPDLARRFVDLLRPAAVAPPGPAVREFQR